MQRQLRALFPLVWVLGCNGATSRSTDSVDASTDSSAQTTGNDSQVTAESNTSSSGSTATLGGNETTGTGGTGATTSSTSGSGVLEILETLPWFDGSGALASSNLGRAGAGGSTANALSTTPDEPRAALGTHLPSIDFRTQSSGVSFRARASQQVTLLVSLTQWDRINYWEDAEQGFDWPAAQVAVSTEWQEFNVPFDSMQPLGDGTPVHASAEGSAIFFLLEDVEGATLWLENVLLLPLP